MRKYDEAYYEKKISELAMFRKGAKQEEPVEEEKVEAPAPVVEEVKPVVEPEPVVEEKVEEPAPVVEEAPVEEPVEEVAEEAAEEGEGDEKKKIVRIPFPVRMKDAEKDLQQNYNELKSEILSYGVKSRISNSGDTFRLHTKTYVKITIAGKSLKLYFALEPKDYLDSKMPLGDASAKEIYKDIPLVFKVKSDLSVRRAKQLIADAMAKDNLAQGEVEAKDWVKEIE